MSELSPETRALIANLRDGDRPTDADRARNRVELTSRLGIGVVAAGGAVVAAKTAAASTAAASIGAAGGTKIGLGGGLSLSMKIAGAAFVASGIAVSTAAVLHETQKPEPVVVAPVVATKAAPKVARAAAPSGRPSRPPAASEQNVTEPDEAPATVDPVNPPPREAMALPVAPAPVFRAPARRTSEPVAALPVVPAQTQERPTAPANAVEESREAQTPVAAVPAREGAPNEVASTRSETTGAPPVREPATITATTLDAETVLVRRAQEAIVSGDWPRALTLVDEHARKFPHGVLTEERDVVRVTAICASGQVERARVAVSRFVATYPHSPMTARVRRTCEAR